MSKILIMLQLQQELNDATNGDGWEQGVTKDGKLIDWYRCAYLECSELIESYPWKHWKNINADPDYDNIKIEVVDIWHFIMSQAISDYKVYGGNNDSIVTMIESLPNYKLFVNAPIPTSSNIEKEITTVENLMLALLNHAPANIVLEDFFQVAIQSGINLDSMYNLYIGKNMLNKFRQGNGYKDGSYIKIWNGEEDNVVMQRILTETPSITPYELYDKLDQIYLHVLKEK